MRDNIDILSRSISKSIDLCKLNLDVDRWQRILFSGLVLSRATEYGLLQIWFSKSEIIVRHGRVKDSFTF